MGVALATHWKTVVVSADSRQFYKEMCIGTAKPLEEEQKGIPHYFIDSHSIKNPLTAADYEKEASALLNRLFEEHDIVILVGGSGLFIDALCYGLDDVPMNEEIKQQLINEFQEKGLVPLCEELQEKDPEYYKIADVKNPVRVIRALEVIRTSGRAFSSFQQSERKNRNYSLYRFVIDLPRELLYERINKRVDSMMQNGLLQEASSLYEFKDLQVLNTVGYTELFDYVAGETGLEVATELIKRNTRRYAKRQLTWFRRDPDNVWISTVQTEEQLNQIINTVN